MTIYLGPPPLPDYEGRERFEKFLRNEAAGLSPSYHRWLWYEWVGVAFVLLSWALLIWVTLR